MQLTKTPNHTVAIHIQISLRAIKIAENQSTDLKKNVQTSLNNSQGVLN